MSKLTITLDPIEPTAKTVKFAETLPEGDWLAQTKMGTVYVPKSTLVEMGYQGGAIKLTLETAAA